MTATSRAIKWIKSCTGHAWFAYVQDCKIVELTIGVYVVERITEEIPTDTIGIYATLVEALAATDT